MTIVVDDQFFSQLLCLDHESRWPVWPESNDGSDFTVRRDQHRSKVAAISGKRIRGARPASITAGNDAACCCHRSRMQELSAIHEILRKGRRRSRRNYTPVTAESLCPRF